MLRGVLRRFSMWIAPLCLAVGINKDFNQTPDFEEVRMPRLLSVNVGLPRDVTWNGKTVRTSVWKAQFLISPNRSSGPLPGTCLYAIPSRTWVSPWIFKRGSLRKQKESNHAF